MRKGNQFGEKRSLNFNSIKEYPRLPKLILALSVAIALLAWGCNSNKRLTYPKARKDSVVDNYFGVKVADPYRWMENVKSPEVKKWVSEENKLTRDYLSKIPFRDKLRKRFKELWNYEKYSAPRIEGEYYFYSKNNGLQEQSVVYYQKGLNGQAEVFLDPNKFSKDGSVSLAGMSFSRSAKYCSYSISRGGSDWREFYVMSVKDKKLLPDHLQWIKFSGMSWFKDGFYYSRYDEPKGKNKLKVKVKFQKVFYHKVGTKQSKDVLIYQDKKHPYRGFSAGVTDDGKYLVISIWEGSSNNNLLAYGKLSRIKPKIKMIFGKAEANYSFINNLGNKFLILTNYKAPNYKVVLVDPNHPAKEKWKTIIPESKYVINSASVVGGKLFVTYLKDANTKVSVFDLTGKKLYDVKLPGIGTAYGFWGKKNQKELFYTFTSFTYPPTIYRYDVEKNKTYLFKKSNLKFNIENYVTKEVFYKSKDGTKIPLFIVHKKGLKLDGDNPTMLYGYGGFNISMRPSFRITILPLLENGGVYAMACLRGGGEYGEKWHKAGMLFNKQNVFDDFVYAAKYLINEKYTSPKKLAIFGGSNGGLLIGAVTNQHPELFRVAIAAVGVMDMLRFQKFTIGWAWVPEYGSSDNEKQFKYLYKYSPLHNIKSGLNYPAMLITTADHDDRVFPAHSFKYTATLQEKYKGNNPILIRIETKVGHGAGASTSKTINLYTDILSFMFYNMGENMY